MPVELDAGRGYVLEVEVRHQPTGQGLGGVSIGAQAPVTGTMLDDAVAAASEADVSVIVVGTNADWECEGWDRDSLALPGDQDELISRLAAAGKQTVVVINAGSPVSMPWLDQVDAVLMAWFPGQEMGEAIADVLLGEIEPQGRLPVSFPARLEDTPAFEHHPGRNGVANYAEGRLIGYRWYDTVGRLPAFPFGFGLGYARVVVTGARRSGHGEIEVDLRNESDRDGVQVVQVYAARLDRPRAGADEPAQQLVGFTKAAVPAGATETVTVELDPRTAQTWSIDAHEWVRAAGSFELRIGTSSRDFAVRLPYE